MEEEEAIYIKGDKELIDAITVLIREAVGKRISIVDVLPELKPDTCEHYCEEHSECKED